MTRIRYEQLVFHTLVIEKMAEIDFMSVDPDNEISDHEEDENSAVSKRISDVRVPQMKEVLNKFVYFYILDWATSQ